MAYQLLLSGNNVIRQVMVKEDVKTRAIIKVIIQNITVVNQPGSTADFITFSEKANNFFEEIRGNGWDREICLGFTVFPKSGKFTRTCGGSLLRRLQNHLYGDEQEPTRQMKIEIAAICDNECIISRNAVWTVKKHRKTNLPNHGSYSVCSQLDDEIQGQRQHDIIKKLEDHPFEIKIFVIPELPYVEYTYLLPSQLDLSENRIRVDCGAHLGHNEMLPISLLRRVNMSLEENQQVLVVPQVDLNSFNLFVRFLKGTIRMDDIVSGNEICSLYKAADLLGIQNLKHFSVKAFLQAPLQLIDKEAAARFKRLINREDEVRSTELIKKCEKIEHEN